MIQDDQDENQWPVKSHTGIIANYLKQKMNQGYEYYIVISSENGTLHCKCTNQSMQKLPKWIIMA